MKGCINKNKGRRSPSFQPRKIHIDGFVVREAVSTFERDLKNTFSKYGNVEDVKVLKNCELKSGKQGLRVRHLQE